MTVRQQFRFSGDLERWTVPADLALGKVTVYLAGAASGGPFGFRGAGGSVRADVTVMPDDVIYVVCGEVGHRQTSESQPGAFNGGARGGVLSNDAAHTGWSGGGATDLRIGGVGNGARQVVAGGAGGAGGGNTTALPGDGGASPGGNGGGPSGGNGGTSSAGGTGGSGTGGTAGLDGTVGTGGRGSATVTPHFGDSAGGGGGGGWYGGGGGGGADSAHNGGGGGGGSSYASGDRVIGGTVTSLRGTNGFTSITNGYGYGWIEYAVVPGKPLPTTSGEDFYDVAAPITAAAAFTSSDTSDVQTKLQIRWRSGTDAWTTESVETTADTLHVFAAHAFDAFTGQLVEWQMRVQGGAAVWSAWSLSAYFTPVAKPATPTLDAGTDLTSTTPGYTLDCADVFTYWQIDVYDDDAGDPGQIVVSSGVLTQAPAAAEVVDVLTDGGGNPLPIVAAGVYHLLARVAQYPYVWSDEVDTGPLVADIQAPNAPAVTMSVHTVSASVVVQIENPLPDDFPAVSNRLYRTVGDAAETLLTDEIDPDGSYTDWEARFNIPTRYRVEAISAAGTATSSE